VNMEDGDVKIVLGEIKVTGELELKKFGLEWIDIFTNSKQINQTLYSILNLYFNKGDEEKKTTTNYYNFVVHCKKSKYDVYIGRPNPSIPTKDFRWGNPFKITDKTTRDDVLRMYEEWIYKQPKLMEQAKKELKGKILACWCHNGDRTADQPPYCHGDILARIANED